METVKRDLRVYQYNCGQLQKVGRGKTGPRPHIFEDLEVCTNHINFLREKYKGFGDTQFIVVEYFGPYNSRIVQIFE
jgi:hypothetical protein